MSLKFYHALTDDELKNILKSIFILASDIENGLRQIAQNAIQHSKNESCLLALRLNRKQKELKLENSLEMILADWNDEYTVIASFIITKVPMFFKVWRT